MLSTHSPVSNCSWQVQPALDSFQLAIAHAYRVGDMEADASVMAYRIWRFGQLERDEDAAFICRVNLQALSIGGRCCTYRSDVGHSPRTLGDAAIRGGEHTRRSHRLRRSRGTGNGDMQIGPGSKGRSSRGCTPATTHDVLRSSESAWQRSMVQSYGRCATRSKCLQMRLAGDSPLLATWGAPSDDPAYRYLMSKREFEIICEVEPPPGLT